MVVHRYPAVFLKAREDDAVVLAKGCSNSPADYFGIVPLHDGDFRKALWEVLGAMGSRSFPEAIPSRRGIVEHNVVPVHGDLVQHQRFIGRLDRC